MNNRAMSTQDYLTLAKVLPLNCAGQSSLSWQELWSRSDKDSLLLIDIRDEVRKQEKVPNSIHIPMGTFLSQMHKHELIEDEEEVFVFCNTDNRSTMALFLLRLFGYANAKKVDGGYQEYLRLQGMTQHLESDFGGQAR